MPGLLRGMARTAVVAGTATAVSNRVSRRQARRWSAEGEEYVPARMAPAEPAYAAPAPAPAVAAGLDQRIEQLKELGRLKDKGVLTDEEFAAEKRRILA